MTSSCQGDTSIDVQDGIQNPRVFVMRNSHDLNERLFKYCKQHVGTTWSMWWWKYCRMMWSEYRCAHKFMRFDFVCACEMFSPLSPPKTWMGLYVETERSNLVHPSKHTLNTYTLIFHCVHSIHTHTHTQAFHICLSICSVRHVRS